MTGTDRVGVLGVGRMGAGVLRRLIELGFAPTAYDIDPVRLTEVGESRAVWAATAAELASTVDVLITVLPGPGEVKSALGGPGGALAQLRPGSVWLDLTSNHPDLAEALAAEARERGVASVAAPMGGGPENAAAGTLTLFVGGPASHVERVAPLLDALTVPGGVRRTGDRVADAHTVKLAVNALWFAHAAVATEVLLLTTKAGIEVDVFREALRGSAGDSAFASRHLDALLAGDYLPSFGIDRVVEELDAVTELAQRAGTPAGILDVVVGLHRDALDRFGSVNGELLGPRLLEERAGITVRGVSLRAQKDE